MKLNVLKFGGTSQSYNGYQSCLKRILEEPNDRYIIVVSGLSGVTNLLLKYIESENKSIIDNIIKKHIQLVKDLDLGIEEMITQIIRMNFSNYQSNLQGKIDLIKMGEKLSSMILNLYLKNRIGGKIKLIPAEDIIKSKSENTSLYQLNNLQVCLTNIETAFSESKIIVTQGFMGSTPSGKTFLLGRGGSDTSGSIIANYTNASVYEIWTDVNGIYQMDPRLLKEAKIIKELTYTMAQELSAMGSKVIHPYCIKPCQEKNIPILIKNSFVEDNEINTIIKEEADEFSFGISIQKGVTFYRIKSLNMWSQYGFVSNIFKIFGDNEIDVDIISTSQFEISTTTQETEDDKILKVEEQLKKDYQVEVLKDLNLVSLTSNKLIENKIMGKVEELLLKYKIYLHSFSSNKLSISYLLEKKDSSNFSKELFVILNSFM